MSGLSSRITRIACIGASLWLAHCKDPLGSSHTKTLDNFAEQNQTAHINACDGQGRNRTQLYAGNNPDVIRALSAVPESVQADFFVDFKGQILLVDDPFAVCQTRMQQASSLLPENTQGCWAYNPEQKTAEIIVGDTPRAIQHDLVREFGFFYHDVSIARSISPQGQVSRQTTPQVSAAKTMLAINFLADLMENQGNLGAVGQTVGLQVPQGARYHQIRQAFLALPEQKQNFLTSHVTAEAFDNVFCSDETRDALDRFTRTKASALALFADLGAQSLFPIPERGPGYATAATFHARYGYQLAQRRQQGLDNGHQVLDDLSQKYVRTAGQNSGAYLTTTNYQMVFLLMMGLGAVFGGFVDGSGATMPPNNVLTSTGTTPPTTVATPVNTPTTTVATPVNTPTTSQTQSPNNTSTVTGATGQLTQQQREIVDASNKWRAKLGLGQLQVDPELTSVCQKNAEIMLSEMNMYHVPGNPYAENVHQYQEDGYQAVWGVNKNMDDCNGNNGLGWCNHPGHKENLENSGWTRIGVGYAGNAQGSFWCQNFQ